MILRHAAVKEKARDESEETRLRDLSSWPGLSRPSTSSLLQLRKDVDARNKSGHDEGSIG
jgi:hypothetical protein